MVTCKGVMESIDKKKDGDNLRKMLLQMQDNVYNSR